MFEYGTILQTINLTKQAEEALPAELAKGLGMSFARLMQKVSKGLETFQGGGWEILSHQITRIGHSLFVTFIIRRPKKA